MRTKLFSACYLLVALLIVTPNLCASTIIGSGKIVSKTIVVSSFTAIQLMSSADMEITKGANLSVVLTDYENLIDQHELIVTDNKLNIGFKKSVSIRNSKAKIKITIPGELNTIQVTGSGDVVLNHINTINSIFVSGSGNISSVSNDNYKKLDVKISGSGDISLKGKAENSNLSLSGSGDIDFSKLISQNVDCKISGSGDIEVYAEKNLKAAISGSGDISYLGNPKIEKHISGSGSVSRK